MNQTIFKPHTTVATIVREQGRYLLVEELVRGRKVLNQPAGHLDPNESLIDAARRETLEETGYDVAIDHLVGIYQWQSTAGKSFLRFAFAATPIAHYPDRDLDEGIVKALWLSRDELAAQRSVWRSPMVMRNITDFENNRQYPLSILTDLQGR